MKVYDRLRADPETRRITNITIAVTIVSAIALGLALTWPWVVVVAGDEGFQRGFGSGTVVILLAVVVTEIVNRVWHSCNRRRARKRIERNPMYEVGVVFDKVWSLKRDRIVFDKCVVYAITDDRIELRAYPRATAATSFTLEQFIELQPVVALQQPKSAPKK